MKEKIEQLKSEVLCLECKPPTHIAEGAITRALGLIRDILMELNEK